MTSTRTGWGKLPVELRACVIKHACESAHGDPDELGSCRRMAEAGLNRVSKEWEAIARPMQWYHLVLDDRSDVGFFLVHLLPKYAGTWRRFTMTWGSDDRDISLFSSKLRGIQQARQVLAVALPHVGPGRRLWGGAGWLLYAVFRHAMSVTTAIDTVALYRTDWLDMWPKGLPMPGFASPIRTLDIRDLHLHDNEEVGNLLHLVRGTLEELNLEVHNKDFAADDLLTDFLAAWRTEDPVQPALPRLQVLRAPELFVLPTLLGQRNISNCLRHLKIVPVVSEITDFSKAVERHAATLLSFTMDEQEWQDWNWADIRWTLLADSIQLVKDACARHGVRFRWVLRRDNQEDYDAECPEELMGIVELA